jgi:hypothetical protein
MYVDLQQFAAFLFPLPSTVFHADGNSLGKALENSGKQNPKMGFKSPPSKGEKSGRPQKTTPLIVSPADFKDQ